MTMGLTTSNHIQVFERLAYASVALDALTAVTLDRTLDTAIGVCVVGSILAALIWASARGGYRWAAYALMVWFAYSCGATLSEHWASAPTWLHNTFPPSGSAYVRLIDSITLALMGKALIGYFSNSTLRQPALV